jgi:hypothetical protein
VPDVADGAVWRVPAGSGILAVMPDMNVRSLS